MKLSEMLTAIREYPALKIKYEAMREQQASQERTAVQLSIAYNNLQIGNRKLSQKNKALEAALVKLVPRLNSREHCRRFYKTVAPYLDPGGFVLYRSAAELTRFHISTEFATEDNMGKFEEMDGYGMLRYLTADRFGSVEYEIVAPCYPILFYKNQHYGAVMLYGHVHNTREWKLVEKWKNEQWAMGIPSRLINVGCMMDYMRYTPRTLTELLDANLMPEIARDRKDGSAVESAEQQNKRERTWDLNEGYTAEKTE